MASFIDFYRQGQADKEARLERGRQRQFGQLAGTLATTKDRAPVIAQMAAIDPERAVNFGKYYQGQDDFAAKQKQEADRMNATVSLRKVQALLTLPMEQRLAAYKMYAPDDYTQAVQMMGREPTAEELSQYATMYAAEMAGKAGVDLPQSDSTQSLVTEEGPFGSKIVRQGNRFQIVEDPSKTPTRQYAPQVYEKPTPDGKLQRYYFDKNTMQETPVGDPYTSKSVADAGGKAEVKQLDEYISSGIEAADSIATSKQALKLLDDIKTSGISASLLKAKQVFGIDAADEATLKNALELAVIQQLRASFGAQFTAKEGEWLKDVQANYGRSAEGNRAILNKGIELAKRRAKRGADAARYLKRDFDANQIESAMSDEFVGGQLRSNQQQAPQPTQGPIRVNSPKEAMQLPSGTWFITPDGRVKVRP